MDPRTPSRLAGLLGGLCWLARMVMFLAGDGSGTPASVLFWAGSALIGIGLVGAGASTVSSEATWLKLFVGAAFPLLVWSVLQVLHDVADPRSVDGLLGLAFAVVFLVALVRSPRTGRAGERRRTHRAGPTRGAHAR